MFAAGNYATVVSHNPDTKRSRVKLPSGAKKVIPSSNRAMVGEYGAVVRRETARKHEVVSKYSGTMITVVSEVLARNQQLVMIESQNS